MISPYFQSPRKGKGKQKAVAATILTAVASATLIPTAASSFVPEAPAKRSVSTRVTPSPISSKRLKRTQLTSNRPTQSFEPIWSNRFLSSKDNDNPVPVHTLILGTHPSIKSLEQEQYYGHPMNAFWWIAGDCLGFRRAKGISESTGKPYQFAKDLWWDSNHILPYDEQIQRLALSGFALWDVVASCEREGSLDQNIQNETPNAIREFCHDHKSSLRRIVLANGGTGSKMFVKHFRDWLESGELKALPDHEASQKAFGSVIQKGEQKRAKSGLTCVIHDKDKIVLISAIGVSPANARFSYAEKRDAWKEYVYEPGLRDHQANCGK
jgi:hypoxanthine-DNA glycosylase